MIIVIIENGADYFLLYLITQQLVNRKKESASLLNIILVRIVQLAGSCFAN